MIRVVYEPQRGRLRVEGHAGYAPYGSDVVCAAASVLLYTLAETLRELEAMGMLDHCSIALGDGVGELCWTAAPLWRRYVMTAVGSVCVGFRLLARDYGSWVRFEVKG